MWCIVLPSWDLWNYKTRPHHNFSRLHNIIYIALCPFIRLWVFIYLVTYFSHKESSSSWLVIYKSVQARVEAMRMAIETFLLELRFQHYIIIWISFSLSLSLSHALFPFWSSSLTFSYTCSLSVLFINKYTHCAGLAMRNKQKATADYRPAASYTMVFLKRLAMVGVCTYTSSILLIFTINSSS